MPSFLIFLLENSLINIYVIQIYNGEGVYKCDLELDMNIQRPSDIYLDSLNNLYVSCFTSHNVKKFKLNIWKGTKGKSSVTLIC